MGPIVIYVPFQEETLFYINLYNYEKEKNYLDILANDSLQSMKDTEKEINEVAAIKQKYDRAYYARI